ncbi:MAG TPA: methyl-accepting chemotaxis protein [Terracidiphilus sp.]|jgi:methyl-accepting chemotaxis protein
MIKKLTLSARILLIGMALGSLTVVQGFLSLRSMYQTRHFVDSMSGDTYATLFLAGKMKAMAKDQRIAIIMHLIATDDAEMIKQEALVAKADGDLKKMREDYPKNDPKDRELLEQLTLRQGDFFQVWTQIRDLSRAGKKQEAWNLYNTNLQNATTARRKIEEELGVVDKARGDGLTNSAMKELARGIPTIWIILLITIVVGSGLDLAFANLVRRSIEPLEAAIRALGQGVLRGKVDVLSSDDIGSMASYMNGALEQMTGTVSGIDYCSNKISDAASEILSHSAHAAEAAITQRDRIRQIGDSMQQMVQGVQNVSEDSHRASDSAGNTVEIARQGGLIVNDVLVTMRTIADSVNATARKIEELGKSSDQIGKIVAVINEIAEQTNLLALNAAIEAARAGEQGRGFAVVAGEVRRLAERTTSATKEIAQMISTVQTETHQAVVQMKAGTTQVEAGVATTSKAGESLEAIITAVQNVGEMICRISATASQQGGAAQQINSNVEEIAKLTSESAEDAQHSTDSCDHLSQLAVSLKEIVNQFTFHQIISSGSSQ